MLKYGDRADSDKINENSRYTMYAHESAWGSRRGREGEGEGEEIASS